MNQYYSLFTTKFIYMLKAFHTKTKALFSLRVWTHANAWNDNTIEMLTTKAQLFPRWPKTSEI